MEKKAGHPEGAIADTAFRARSLLLCCTEFGSDQMKTFSSKQLGRFNLWAANIGVFAARHSSLDYRLRTGQTVAAAVVGNLEILSSQTLELLKAGKGTLDEEFKQLSEIPLSEVMSWAQSIMTQSAANYSTPADVLESIVATITVLHRLSLSIRKASQRNPLGKARVLFDYDGAYMIARGTDSDHQSRQLVEEVHYDITNNFQDFVSQVLRMRWMAGLERVSLKLPPDDYRRILLERSVEAISIRRRQLTYFQKHQQKLATERFSKNLPSASEKASNQPGFPMIPAESFLSPSSPHAIHHDPVPSATLPSEFRQASFGTDPSPSLAMSSNTSSAASSTISSEGGILRNTGWFEVPPPPALHPDDTEKACPYCALVLPARTFQTRRRAKHWRRHLLEDLQPYTCLFRNCDLGAKGFPDFKAWQRHLHSPHTDSWVCPLHSDDGVPNPCFDTSGAFQDHLRVEHDTSNDIEVRKYLRLASIPAALSQQCFVCLQELSTEIDLQKHVARHLESAFMLALPWNCDLGDDDWVSSNNIASATMSDAISSRSEDFGADFEDMNQGFSADISDTEFAGGTGSNQLSNQEFSLQLANINDPEYLKQLPKLTIDGWVKDAKLPSKKLVRVNRNQGYVDLPGLSSRIISRGGHDYIEI